MSKTAQPDDVRFSAGAQLSVDPAELRPHPKNDEIYVNDDIGELVERIDEHGFQEEHRILITTDGMVLSGHRRWRAAKELGLEEVPVEVKPIADDQEALLTLLLANEYRNKKPAEEINEGEAWEEIESQAAAEREKDPVQNFAQGETGTTREKVGEKIGMSGESYRKGRYVKRHRGQFDVAQEMWEKLESGEESIHGAYTSVRDVVKADEEPDDPDEDAGSEDETTDGESTESTDTDDGGGDDVAGGQDLVTDTDADDGPGPDEDDSTTGKDLIDKSSEGDEEGESNADEDGGDDEDGEDGEATDEATEGGQSPNADRSMGKLVDRVKELEAENERLEERIKKVRQASGDQAQIIFDLRFGDELSEEDVKELQDRVEEQQDVIGELNGTVQDYKSALKSLVQAVKNEDDRDIQRASSHAEEVLE